MAAGLLSPGLESRRLAVENIVEKSAYARRRGSKAFAPVNRPQIARQFHARTVKHRNVRRVKMPRPRNVGIPTLGRVPADLLHLARDVALVLLHPLEGVSRHRLLHPGRAQRPVTEDK